MIMSRYHRIINTLLPNICTLCLHPTNTDLVLCGTCIEALPWNTHACLRCAIPLTVNEKVCGQCLKKPPPFHNTIAMLHYEKPVSNLIAKMKYQQELSISKLFGALLANTFESKLQQNILIPPQAIIPVPLHHKRIRERGYNQAMELARPIAKQIKIPILTDQCQRIRATEKQSLTHVRARSHNMKNAFVAKFDKPLQHVALLDDVITTGNTITEVCKALQKAGVVRIDVWAIARTQLRNVQPRSIG